jgi:hypothetical protein
LKTFIPSNSKQSPKRYLSLPGEVLFDQQEAGMPLPVGGALDSDKVWGIKCSVVQGDLSLNIFLLNQGFKKLKNCNWKFVL